MPRMSEFPGGSLHSSSCRLLCAKGAHAFFSDSFRCHGNWSPNWDAPPLDGWLIPVIGRASNPAKPQQEDPRACLLW